MALVDIERELRAVGEAVKQLIKQDIQQKGLVDTGKMLNGVNFTVDFSSQGFSIEFNDVDYFTFVDAKYNIIDDVLNSPQFAAIEERIGQIYFDYYEEKLGQIFIKLEK